MSLNVQKMKTFVQSFVISVCVIICLLISFLPIVCLLIGILIYRGCVWLLLKTQHGNEFRGFLNNHDALWAVEDNESLSVIHVLMLFDSSTNIRDEKGSPTELYRTLEEKLKHSIGQPQLAKVFQRRRLKYGYNYLVDVPQNQINLEEYLRITDVPSSSSSRDLLSPDDLQRWIAGQYTRKLPGNHANFMEILVSSRETVGECGQQLIPVLFRIHHSLADGVAIVKLLSSSWSTTPTEVHSICRVAAESNEHTSTPVRKLKLKTLKAALKGFSSLPRVILQRRPDFNSIHNDTNSSEKKFVNWYFEADDRMLHKIKAVKAAVESGITFQDVICACLSVALQRHFNCVAQSTSRFESVPSVVTIGNAVQRQAYGESQQLTNNCVYNFERIPIRGPAMSRGGLIDDLKEIRGARSEIAAFQGINYVVIKIASLFPQPFLRRILTRNRCSLGLSNIPGPATGMQLGDYSLKHLTFWTPNRFSTRLGITIFSIHNRLHLGIGGDEATFGTMDSQKMSGLILEGIVEEVDRMYNIVVNGQ